MMKKVLLIVGSLGIFFGIFLLGSSVAGEMTNAEIMRELKALKEKIRLLEQKLEAQENPKETEPEKKVHKHGAAGVKGLSDRVKRLEKDVKKGLLGKWSDKISLSGLVEVEANYKDLEYSDRGAKDTDSSDIALAAVELGIDTEITKHLGGHILFLWEEDDTESVDLDEGFIIIDGKDTMPLFLNVGKMYVPYGYFESHFISNPLTKKLAETRETAVKVGFDNETVELCFSVFNGDIDERGGDNHIDGYAAGARFSAPEGLTPGLGLKGGISFISNIADTKGLQDRMSLDVDGDGTADNVVADNVNGVSAFLSLNFNGFVFLEAEYVGAIEDFKAGELNYDGMKKRRPQAWNLELTMVVKEDFEFGIKYEGSTDCGRSLADDFLPQKQYGGVINYDLFENVSLALEYLHGEYKNRDKRDLVTTQLAIEF